MLQLLYCNNTNVRTVYHLYSVNYIKKKKTRKQSNTYKLFKMSYILYFIYLCLNELLEYINLFIYRDNIVTVNIIYLWRYYIPLFLKWTKCATYYLFIIFCYIAMLFTIDIKQNNYFKFLLLNRIELKSVSKSRPFTFFWIINLVLVNFFNINVVLRPSLCQVLFTAPLQKALETSPFFNKKKLKEGIRLVEHGIRALKG